MNDPLQTTLADAVQFLQGNGLRYALVGGLAVSFHGQPRATADVDMVIAADVDRALSIVEILPTTKFQPLVTDVSDIVERSFMLPLRHRTTGVKVDLAIGLSGFEQQAVNRAKAVSFGGTEVSMIGAEDLLIMKVLANRPRDDQDALGIVAQQDRLDWGYCLHVAAQLGEAVGQDLLIRMKALRPSRDQTQ